MALEYRKVAAEVADLIRLFNDEVREHVKQSTLPLDGKK